MRVCIIKNCNRKHKASGFCAMHNLRHKKGTNLNASSLLDPRPAIIEGDVAKVPIGVNAKDGWHDYKGYAARSTPNGRN